MISWGARHAATALPLTPAVFQFPVNLRHALTIILACSLVAAGPSRSEEGSLLKKATFCHGLDEKQRPKDTAESFAANETIYLSIELKGRPTMGIVSTTFMFRNDVMAVGKVDVATVNEGAASSVGENTFAGFNLNHKNPLPVGDCYTADVSFDGQPLGTFPFRIAPPKDALPSKIKSTTLAKGVDEHYKPVNETHEFDGKDKVFLAGTGDLGLSSWLEVTWTVGGKVDEAGTRSLTIEENKSDVPFSFSFIPAGGWPAGDHEAVLQLDGKEVAREKFTVKNAAPAAAGTKIEVASVHLYKGGGKAGEGKAVEAFTPSDPVLVAEWKLKQAVPVKGLQIAWMLEEGAGVKEKKIATSDLDGGVNDYVTSTLTIKKGLPVGKYRVELLQDGKRVDAKTFEVK
jgi:hypothetical protein